MTAQQSQSDITIGDIEVELTKLRPNWATGVEPRELALLFAILKVGTSTQKLVWFTGYPATFVINLVEELRQRGKLFTGLSPQFVLSQCPGSEDLIAVVTGARPFVPAPVKPVIRLAPAQPIKEEIMSKESTPTPAACCKRNTWCVKESGHRGTCRKPPEQTRAHTVIRASHETPALIAPKSANGNSQRSQKSIPFAGGTLTLVVDVNLLELKGAEREFVFALIDQLQGYEAKGAA